MKTENIDVDGHYRQIGEVLTEDQKKKGVLIHALQKLQKEHNYLPEDKLRGLSAKLGIPLAEIYSTASFYKHFYFKPRGKNIVCVCTGTACHVRGAAKVLQRIEDEFGVKEGQTTADMSLTLETVGCVGCCGLAPVVTVNDEVIGEVTPGKIGEVLDKTRARTGEGE